MSDAERSDCSSEPKYTPISPSMTRELREVMEMTEIPSTGHQFHESFPVEDISDLDGEALSEFKRRRNAFHSRKKRRRKKQFVERLQACFDRVSEENQRLKRDQAFLTSKISEALELVNQVEHRIDTSTGNAELLALQQSNSLQFTPFLGQGAGNRAYPEVGSTLAAAAAVAQLQQQEEYLAAARRAAVLRQVSQARPFAPSAPWLASNDAWYSLGHQSAQTSLCPLAAQASLTEAALAHRQALQVQSVLAAEQHRQQRLQLLVALEQQRQNTSLSTLIGGAQASTRGNGRVEAGNHGDTNQDSSESKDPGNTLPTQHQGLR